MYRTKEIPHVRNVHLLKKYRKEPERNHRIFLIEEKNRNIKVMQITELQEMSIQAATFLLARR